MPIINYEGGEEYEGGEGNEVEEEEVDIDDDEEDWSDDEFDDADLADFFEVTIATITNWKIRHEEFLVSIKLGKDEPDEFVNRSLYQRARGYTFDTLKIVYDKDLGKFVEHPHREHVPPDTTACIFWLKNRQPQLWRDKHELEHTGKDGDLIVNITAGMTDQQAERVYQDTIHRVRLNGNGAAK